MIATLVLFSCKKDNNDDQNEVEPRLIFKFKFDPDQERLDNLGQASTVPAGHAAQDPDFNSISAHYIELTEGPLVQLGGGEILYEGPETDAGGDMAVDFDQAKLVAEGEAFFSIPLSQVAAGDYEYMRISLSYQNFDITYLSDFGQLTGTLASFIGYNNYITSYTINEETIDVNDDKLQGYWGFETVGIAIEGQAPEGATTVPNPLFDSSPIPQGSCLVTGAFENGLTITGNETGDVVVTMSLSTNNSFEWIEVTEDGLFEPSDGETVVDMGIRGLIPTVE
jgi:hypothetical protein